MAFGDSDLDSRNLPNDGGKEGLHLSLLDILGDFPGSKRESLPASRDFAAANDNGDGFLLLKDIKTPDPGPSARDRALQKALEAFDLAQKIKLLSPANDN